MLLKVEIHSVSNVYVFNYFASEAKVIHVHFN